MCYTKAMKQRIGIIVGAIGIVGCLIAATLLILRAQPQEPSSPATADFRTLDEVRSLATTINFSADHVSAVNPASQDSGNLGEKIIGDPDTASVVIYEFADYACSHCAETNTELNRIYHDYDGAVAIVFRNYVLGFQNSVPTASAANAAYLQGYWSPYKDLLFSEQSSWFRLQGGNLESYLVEAFETVSGGAGDTAQFIQDMYSDAVVARIAYDMAAGNSIEVSSTPYLIIDGVRVTTSELRNRIDQILNK